jgi:type IV secretion system protein VirD4
VRGFLGLAIDAITIVPGQAAHRVAFFLDEFGRMDRFADSITLLRGYGAQLWLFVQDLSQLRAVYPRWQSFMANTTRQFFGTADYDTARYIADALGQHTIGVQSTSRSYQYGRGLMPGTRRRAKANIRTAIRCSRRTRSCGSAPSQPIVMVAGEPPYLLPSVSEKLPPG